MNKIKAKQKRHTLSRRKRVKRKIQKVEPRRNKRGAAGGGGVKK